MIHSLVSVTVVSSFQYESMTLINSHIKGLSPTVKKTESNFGPQSFSLLFSLTLKQCYIILINNSRRRGLGVNM